MKNKPIWKLVFFAGFTPFVIAIASGLGAATTNFSTTFDFSVFMNTVLAYSKEYWLAYLMGILLSLMAFYKAKIR